MKTKQTFYKAVNVATGKEKLFNFYDLAMAFINSQDQPKNWRIIKEEM